MYCNIHRNLVITSFFDWVSITNHSPSSHALETHGGDGLIIDIVLDLFEVICLCDRVLGIRVSTNIHYSVAHFKVAHTVAYLHDFTCAVNVTEF